MTGPIDVARNYVSHGLSAATKAVDTAIGEMVDKP